MKFIYDDKVKVVKGFYRGQSGVVKNISYDWIKRKTVYYYTVINGRLKFEAIPEEYLEKV